MKAYCIWCEPNPNSSSAARPKDGMAWIHLSCFMEMSNTMSELDHIKKLLNDGESYEEIARFLKRMEDHRRRWNGSMKLLASITKDPVYDQSTIGR